MPSLILKHILVHKFMNNLSFRLIPVMRVLSWFCCFNCTILSKLSDCTYRSPTFKPIYVIEWAICHNLNTVYMLMKFVFLTLSSSFFMPPDIFKINFILNAGFLIYHSTSYLYKKVFFVCFSNDCLYKIELSTLIKQHLLGDGIINLKF